MIIFLLILLAIASRFVPHINNFAAITAVAIFAGSQLPKKQALLVPLGARLISDIFLGFFHWQIMLAVYAAHALGVLIGAWIKNSKTQTTKWSKILVSGLASSILFFLITNFALLYSFYPHTWQGILQSYINGLPFLQGSVLGDALYTLGIFAVYELAVYLGPKIAQKWQSKPV